MVCSITGKIIDLFCIISENAVFGDIELIPITIILTILILLYVLKMPGEISLGISTMLFYAVYLMTSNELYLIAVYISILFTFALISWRIIKVLKL